MVQCAAKEPALECSVDGAASLYTRKIEPILQDDRPTRCNQCHLAGIDLALFVHETPCQTMACMAQLGLVPGHPPAPRPRATKTPGAQRWVTARASECPDR
jgi:hypothetical protein